MNKHGLLPNLSVLLALQLGATGCGPGSADPMSGGVDTAKVQTMSSLYGDFLIANGNKAPEDEATFRSYLASQRELLEEQKMTADDLFVSPRSGQPFQWVYDAKPPAGPVGMVYVGYESEPVDGKRLVIATRGMHELIDESRFRALFPKAP